MVESKSQFTMFVEALIKPPTTVPSANPSPGGNDSWAEYNQVFGSGYPVADVAFELRAEESS